MHRAFSQLLPAIRYAVRSLRRSRAFTATVVLTLGLGVGANTMMFGVIDHLMFRPYPSMRDPSTVHRVYTETWNRGTPRTLWDSEYKRYLDLQLATTSFSQTAAFTNRLLPVGTGAASRERMVAAVSASFFDFFEAKPALGRFFGSSEDVTPRGADVAILGHGFWTSEYGSRDVRGQTLMVGTIPATIIGVAPEGFIGVSDADPPAVFIPITTFAGARGGRDAATYFTAYYWRWMEIMVRRKPGVSLAAATADASRAATISWNLRRTFEPDLPPVELARPRAIVSSLRIGAGPDPSMEARTALWVAGVAAIVLLVACANVANLLLARALDRQRDTAVRIALGASRSRLTAQALAETIVLAVAGAAVGLLLAQWGSPMVRGLLGSTPISDAVSGNPRTLGATLFVTLVVALLTGIAPALATRRGDVAHALRSGGRGATHSHSRARTALLVAQAALSVVLLIGAALFVKSLARVQQMRLGFDPKSILIATRNLRDVQLDDSGRIALRRRLVETAQAIPGVERASWTISVPFGTANSTGLFVPGIDSVERLGRFTYQAATSDYFRTMGTRIIRGRGFTDDDRRGAPRVAVVSESMARRVWPGRDALGQCIRVFADTVPCATIVGVAEDIASQDIASSERLHWYAPLDQFAPAGGSTLVMRLRSIGAPSRETVRLALQRAMPGTSYITVQPMTEIVARSTRSWTLGAAMFSAFGLLALVVAAIGLYGVIAYTVSRRMQEMGIRIALGAKSPDIIRLVVGRAVLIISLGSGIGLVAAAAAGPWVQPLLFRVSARDPVIYAAVAAVLGIVAIIASATPALRATRANPSTALRSQ
jgi:putative ABC transport system permease protein